MDEYVGYSNCTAVFSQSSGVNVVSHAGDLGVAGTYGVSASYTLSGGSLAASTERIGDSGDGSFIQSAGTNDVSGFLWLGYSNFASGVYTLNGGLLLPSNLTQGSGSSAFNFGGGTLGASAAWSSSLAMTLTGSGGNATVDTTGGNIGLSGVLSGSGGLSKAGANTLTLSASNSYGGGTTIGGGTLQLGNAFALGSTTAPLAVNGGVLDIHGYSVNVGALSGGGTIDNLAGTGSLTVGNDNASSTFSGIIQDTVGQINFTKAGSGVLALTGTVAVAGTATVNAGTLQILSGSLSSASMYCGNVVQSGGVNSMLNVLGSFYVGGSYALSGGSLIANSPNIVGSFFQSGGVNTTNDGDYLLVSYGTYNLVGGLLSSSQENVGPPTFSGTGSFMQSGGTNAVGQLLNVAYYGSGNYTLTGSRPAHGQRGIHQRQWNRGGHVLAVGRRELALGKPCPRRILRTPGHV